jgi:beta-glucosidase
MTFDVEYVLSQLTPAEKASLVAGVDHWHTAAIPRLSVPSIRTSDGPNGIRGQHHFNSTPTAVLPVGTALASTWNTDLLYKAGELLEREAKAKGSHVVLAPTVNIARIPNGGRGFESFSEDPFLSGELASHYINGLQSRGVAATIKHFVGNDQEKERFSSDSIISQRALREIYLKPFEIAITKSNPKCVMTSYNRVNGTHTSEHGGLYHILREEWGWKGLVMSDWTGTYSTSAALNAGLDLEMPGPSRYRGDLISHSLVAKTISEETLNERVRNVLNLVKQVQESGIPENSPELQLNRPEDRQLLRDIAAEALVLLKNEENILPFKKTKTLVVGPNAIFAAFSGGGSALATGYYSVSPLAGIEDKIGSESVTYEVGAYNHKFLPSLKDELFNGDENGTLIEIFNEPLSEPNRKPFHVLNFKDINYFRMNDYVHPDLLSLKFYATLTSTFVPRKSGEYIFGLTVLGTAILYINDTLVVDNSTKQERGESFYGYGTAESTGKFTVNKGETYDLRIEFGSALTSKISKDAVFFRGGGLRFGGVHLVDNAIESAVAQAKQFDQVIVVTGLNHDYESEGADREDLKIPGKSDELIEALLGANPNTVVVIQSGTPVEMPWASKVKALLYQSFGGAELGNALADVVYGDVNPSGKLPITFPIRFEDTPSFINNTTNQGKVLYGEDIYVGYRFYEKIKRQVLFPFGYGLSYTTFELKDLDASVKGNILEISVSIQNTGSIAGAGIIQFYVGSDGKERPIKELKSFAKKVLQRGETARLSTNINLDQACEYFDQEIGKWVSKAGKYEVIVGQSSDDEALKAEFAVQTTTKYLRKLV